MEVDFEAIEQRADGRLGPASYRFEGSSESGWHVAREGRAQLSLGPGYRLLRSERCGVCSTDLARCALPFPLPQITGHEVVALDDAGVRHVVEINASHRARGIASDCCFCRAGLATHCPERRVLGIHDLPGGFGPWILAPVRGVLPLPDALDPDTAVLTEPFAAALHAVEVVDPRPGDSVAVLGPRRLGLLVIAALAAHRRRSGRDFGILALARRRELLERARDLGADAATQVHGEGEDLPSGLADVVIDTTGSPPGLDLALRLARREVHLKSTHGRAAAGLGRLTELVVDELVIEPLSVAAPARSWLAWLPDAEPPAAWAGDVRVIRSPSAAAALAAVAAGSGPDELGRADVAVVGSAAQLDQAVRPRRDSQISLLRPGGVIRVAPGHYASQLLRAVVERGLRVSSSRCGDLHEALALLASDPELRELGAHFITDRFEPARLSHAFAAAASPACVKAVVGTLV